jgi:hypothetical protein
MEMLDLVDITLLMRLIGISKMVVILSRTVLFSGVMEDDFAGVSLTC